MTRLASLAFATLIATGAMASAATYDSPRDIFERGETMPVAVGTAVEVPSRSINIPSDRVQTGELATVWVVPSREQVNAGFGPGDR